MIYVNIFIYIYIYICTLHIVKFKSHYFHDIRSELIPNEIKLYCTVN